jgi:hypothetical protein
MTGRPKPTVIGGICDSNGRTWEIIAARGAYMITFRGQAVAVRYRVDKWNTPIYKYRKMLVNNEGNARLEVKRLNELFKTDDFDYTTL